MSLWLANKLERLMHRLWGYAYMVKVRAWNRAVVRNIQYKLK